MSIIAYRRGILVTDSSLTVGAMRIVPGTTKAWQLTASTAVAFCGALCAAREALDTLRADPSKGMRMGPSLVSIKDAHLVVFYYNSVQNETNLYQHTDEGILHQVLHARGYFALGAGAEVAMGAFYNGADPRNAALAACAHNVWCSEPLTQIILE